MSEHEDAADPQHEPHDTHHPRASPDPRDTHDPQAPHEPHAPHEHDPSCEVAHGGSSASAPDGRSLIAVYATPLASCLLRWGAELGFRTTLVEPDDAAMDAGVRAAADTVVTDLSDLGSVVEVGAHTDVVITDHHRDDLGPVMAPLVAAAPRWIGIIGSPRHEGPHVAALRAQGLSDAAIATVHRPIGVDIGSKAPPEIALSVLAGLIADRNGREAGLPARPAAATADAPP